MNQYTRVRLSPEPRRCRKSLPNRFRRPVIACFLIPESRNFNGLVLIRFASRARAVSFGACSGRVTMRESGGTGGLFAAE